MAKSLMYAFSSQKKKKAPKCQTFALRSKARRKEGGQAATARQRSIVQVVVGENGISFQAFFSS